MKAFDFRFLPFAGGLLDQPAWLIEDLAQIQAAYNRVFRWVMRRRQIFEDLRGRRN